MTAPRLTDLFPDIMVGDAVAAVTHRTVVGAQVSLQGLTDIVFEACSFHDVVFLDMCGTVSFGAGTDGASRYVGCRFAGVRLDHLDFGWADFESCAFTDCAIRDFDCFEASFENCTFVGEIRRGNFNAVARYWTRRTTAPVFRSNDFSRCRLIDVGFRGAIDLSAQQFPQDGRVVVVTEAERKLNQRLAMGAALAPRELKDLKWLRGYIQDYGNKDLFVGETLRKSLRVDWTALATPSD
jgi:hypothetical protein